MSRTGTPCRCWAVLMVLTLVGAWTGRGYCPMTSALAAGQGKADAHDCCRTGLSSKAARCCHADTAGATAVAVKQAPTPASCASAPAASFLTVPVQGTTWAVATNGLFPAHSPPPSVLRV